MSVASISGSSTGGGGGQSNTTDISRLEPSRVRRAKSEPRTRRSGQQFSSILSRETGRNADVSVRTGCITGKLACRRQFAAVLYLSVSVCQQRRVEVGAVVPRCVAILDECPRVKLWVSVGQGTLAVWCFNFTVPFWDTSGQRRIICCQRLSRLRNGGINLQRFADKHARAVRHHRMIIARHESGTDARALATWIFRGRKRQDEDMYNNRFVGDHCVGTWRVLRSTDPRGNIYKPGKDRRDKKRHPKLRLVSMTTVQE
ncbi:uncharacterized protein LOC118507095 [Anopheles stephensi]|uniref:uncharacterized protein LOC118507095 n=1 Tax=Anopheles stephensi TaxID=30069 RepID=UPI0016588839|nr:uncharacterized protein LOC118507095 [Anopheles stephensi]